MKIRDSRPMANPSPLQCMTSDQERTMCGFIVQRGGSPRGVLSDRKTFGQYGLRTERRSAIACVRTARFRFGAELSMGTSLKRLCITTRKFLQTALLLTGLQTGNIFPWILPRKRGRIRIGFCRWPAAGSRFVCKELPKYPSAAMTDCSLQIAGGWHTSLTKLADRKYLSCLLSQAKRNIKCPSQAGGCRVSAAVTNCSLSPWATG